MDQNEFRTLALAELDAVHRLAYHLADRPQEADDLVQETYLRAFRFADGFELAGHGVRPWLFKILHNVLNTRMAKLGRQPALSDDLSDVPAAPDARPDRFPDEADGIVGATVGLDWEQVDDRLKREVDALPKAFKVVFLLCAVEGLRYREIADVTDLPIGTVMSRLYRARQQLMSRLGTWRPGHDDRGPPRTNRRHAEAEANPGLVHEA